MKLLHIISLYYLVMEVRSATRVKRILRGDRVHGRKNGYTAVNYFAALGSQHGKPWWLLGFWAFAKKHGLYGEILCGGALLTPRIVQTACHCIATYPFGNRDVYVSPALIDHHWEGTMAVYVGTNNRFPTWGHEDEPSMLTISSIESQKFFVHPKCGKMPQTSNVHVSFDVGLVRIEGQWISGHHGVPTGTVVFAPLYSHDHLNQIFTRFMEIQPVCLILGFGHYGIDYPYQSDALRHGWVTLRKYKDCIDSTTEDIPAKSNYSVYLSWACARPMVKFDQSGDAGDSGGPVSCDNEFFGIISSLFLEGPYSTDLYSAIKYTPFVNSYESRAALIELVNSKNAISYPDEVAYFYKTKTPSPDLRRINRFTGHQQQYKEDEAYRDAPLMSRSSSASDVSRVVVILISALLQ